MRLKSSSRPGQMAFAEALTQWHQSINKGLTSRLEIINQVRLKLAEEEDKIRTELQTIKDSCGVVFEAENNNAIWNCDDQKRIYEELSTMSGVDRELLKQVGSLFSHADNIRYVCDTVGQDVPTWFREKYGYLFKKHT